MDELPLASETLTKVIGNYVSKVYRRFRKSFIEDSTKLTRADLAKEIEEAQREISKMNISPLNLQITKIKQERIRAYSTEMALKKTKNAEYKRDFKIRNQSRNVAKTGLPANSRSIRKSYTTQADISACALNVATNANKKSARGSTTVWIKEKDSDSDSDEDIDIENAPVIGIIEEMLGNTKNESLKYQRKVLERFMSELNRVEPPPAQCSCTGKYCGNSKGLRSGTKELDGIFKKLLEDKEKQTFNPDDKEFMKKLTKELEGTCFYWSRILKAYHYYSLLRKSKAIILESQDLQAIANNLHKRGLSLHNEAKNVIVTTFEYMNKKLRSYFKDCKQNFIPIIMPDNTFMSNEEFTQMGVIGSSDKERSIVPGKYEKLDYLELDALPLREAINSDEFSEKFKKILKASLDFDHPSGQVRFTYDITSSIKQDEIEDLFEELYEERPVYDVFDAENNTVNGKAEENEEGLDPDNFDMGSPDLIGSDEDDEETRVDHNYLNLSLALKKLNVGETNDDITFQIDATGASKVRLTSVIKLFDKLSHMSNHEFPLLEVWLGRLPSRDTGYGLPMLQNKFVQMMRLYSFGPIMMAHQIQASYATEHLQILKRGCENIGMSMRLSNGIDEDDEECLMMEFDTGCDINMMMAERPRDKILNYKFELCYESDGEHNKSSLWPRIITRPRMGNASFNDMLIYVFVQSWQVLKREMAHCDITMLHPTPNFNYGEKKFEQGKAMLLKRKKTNAIRDQK